jgi:hypothetical protein
MSSLSPSMCSVPPLAFIARGCMRYYRNIVTVSVHHGGEGYQLWNVPHNWSNLRLLLLKWFSAFTTKTGSEGDSE